MADDATLDRATFTAMTDGKPEDWQAIVRAGAEHRGKHVDHILDQMRLLDDDHGGFAVDRLEHSLQTATRAFKDGRDVRAVMRLEGKRAVVEGTARAVGKKTLVHEEHDDAGQHITIDGTHRRLANDLTLTWKRTTVPLDCDNAFVYDLQVTKESTVD